MTNTPQRGSRTSSPTNKNAPTSSKSHSVITDERKPSPSDSTPATKSSSPREEEEVTQLPPFQGNREQGRRHSSGAKHTHGTDFVKKNRQACKKCENFTGVPRLAGEAGRKDSAGAAVVFPTRTKLGRAPVIGDETGTCSMFGSSFFIGPGHCGVREPILPFKAVVKTPKRSHNYSSSSSSNSNSNSNSNKSNSNKNNNSKSSD